MKNKTKTTAKATLPTAKATPPVKLTMDAMPAQIKRPDHEEPPRRNWDLEGEIIRFRALTYGLKMTVEFLFIEERYIQRSDAPERVPGFLMELQDGLKEALNRILPEISKLEGKKDFSPKQWMELNAEAFTLKIKFRNLELLLQQWFGTADFRFENGEDDVLIDVAGGMNDHAEALLDSFYAPSREVAK